MKVLMVTPSYLPIKGGTETLIQDFSVNLNKIGVQTDILTFNMERKWRPYWRGKVEKRDGINIFKIPAVNWFPLQHSDRFTLGINLIPGRFRHILKKYDIVHFHGADLSFPLFSYTLDKPKIFHSHGFSYDFYRKYYVNRLIMCNIADWYICITKFMGKQFLELGIPAERIRYVPNSVNIELFRPSGEKKDDLILFVGRITFGKGLHVLLKALQYLGKKVHLVIIGPPDWDTQYYRDFLKQIEIENRKGAHKITYLGAQEPANIIKWYQQASIFVLPSFEEAFAVVNLEALACETPVISTNIGGIPEVVNDGEDGILVPPNNPVKLAEAMQYLLDNEDVRKQFGQEGRKKVINNFSTEISIKRLYKIYQEILNELT